MSRKERRLPVLGALVLAIAFTAFSNARAMSTRTGTDRSSGLKLTATSTDDRVCLRVEPPCKDPELRVFRDGRFRHATPEAEFTCFIEETVAEGFHRYDVEAVCPDLPAGTASAVVEIQRPALRITDLRLSGSHVEAGGTLAILGELQGAFAGVQLDASALDSAFDPQAAELTLDGEGFRLVYPLSPDNSRATGVYPVELRFYAGQGELLDVRALTVTYLPEGRSALAFPSAAFVAAELSSEPEPLPGLAVRSIERVSLKGTARSNTPRLFDPGYLPPTSHGLRITYSVPPARGTEGATRIEIQDVGTSGLFRVPVATPGPAEPGCGSTCDFKVTVPFDYDPSRPQHLRVQVSTHDQGWHGSGPQDKAWSTECDGDPETPLPYCNEPTDMVIEGHITFQQRELRAHPTDHTHWLEPQYRHVDHTDSTRPASYTLVKALDDCGRVAETFTDENGDYHLELQTFCGESPVQVWAYSYGAPIQGNDVAVGVWTSDTKPTPTEIDDLTKDNADYTVVAGLVDSFVPDDDYPGAGGLTLDRHFTLGEIGPLFAAGDFPRTGEMSRALGQMRNVRRGLNYMGALIDVEKLDRINLVLTGEPLQGGNNTAAYYPGQHAMIYIPPRGEFGVFITWHEMFHYFDDQTLGDFGNDPGDLGYGRWSEPLANVRAAMFLGGPHMPAFEDTAAENLDYNWNIVSGVPEAPPAVEAGDTWSQGWIWRVAWDLNDGTGAEPLAVDGDDGYDEFDGWLGPTNDPNNSKLHRVILDYFPQEGSFIVNADFEDRGLPGRDLVDFLDGLVCMYGLSETNSGTLLHEVMSYNYAYDHCEP